MPSWRTLSPLARATKDPAFIEALWLLLKIPQAAKAERFAEALRELGVSVPSTLR